MQAPVMSFQLKNSTIVSLGLLLLLAFFLLTFFVLAPFLLIRVTMGFRSPAPQGR